MKKFPEFYDPDVHYRIHQRRPPVPAQSHISSVLAPLPLFEDSS